MPDPIVSSIALTIASNAFSGTLANLFSNYLLNRHRKPEIDVDSLSASLQSHLEITYRKCTKVKTIIHQQEPVNLLDIFVNINFEQSECVFDTYEIVDFTKQNRNIIISGTGGGGKTIFMKYLWISSFVDSRGRIPIFLELRNINQLQSPVLSTYIHRTILQTNALVTEKQFDLMLKSGDFIIILDGFDEIDPDIRSQIEKQILDLSRNNPLCTFIVSGRPDDRFSSWQDFSCFSVRPFNLKQCTTLLDNLEYNKKVTNKFKKELSNGLYERHASFLSNPLLITMMLITFEQFADIPDKVHIFYEHAFSALYMKHDATKEAYSRKFHTNLDYDIFKKVTSYFCLISYLNNKFDFSDDEIIEFARTSIHSAGEKCLAPDFIKDLTESVCLIQRDGLNLVFVHRSFQEYFAAYCIFRVAVSVLPNVLIEVARKRTDSVPRLAYDMNPELVEMNFINPYIEKYYNIIKNIVERSEVMNFCLMLEFSFLAATPTDKEIHIFGVKIDSEFWAFIDLLKIFSGDKSIDIFSRVGMGLVFILNEELEGKEDIRRLFSGYDEFDFKLTRRGLERNDGHRILSLKSIESCLVDPENEWRDSILSTAKDSLAIMNTFDRRVKSRQRSAGHILELLNRS